MSGGTKRPFDGEAPSSPPSSGDSTKRPRLSASPSYSSTASASSSSPLFPNTVGSLDVALRRLSSLPAANDEYGTPLSRQDEDGASTASQRSPHRDEQTVIELDLDERRSGQAVAEQGPEAAGAFENYHLPFGVQYWVDMIAGEIDIGSVGRARVAEVFKELEKLIQKEISKLSGEKKTLGRSIKTLTAGVMSLSKYKKDFMTQSRELQKSMQLVSGFEEEVRDLKMKNYKLEIRLQNELQRSPIPGQFHRDAF